MTAWQKKYAHQTQHPVVIKARWDAYEQKIALHQRLVLDIAVNNAIRKLKGKKPIPWPLNPTSKKKRKRA